MEIQPSFESLGYKYDTDKVAYHGYHRTYTLFLEHIRNQEFSMLEIGLQRMGSAGLWKEYFPHAKIYGIDINEKDAYEGLTIFKADQSSKADLESICAQIPEKLKLIIDDGSHVPEHQIISINTLWDKLEEGGIYIIEDIETSYWKNGKIYGYGVSAGIRSSSSIINQFKEAPHIINKEFFDPKEPLSPSKIERAILDGIESITFSHNAIILIKKRSDWQKYYNRNYRFRTLADPNWR